MSPEIKCSKCEAEATSIVRLRTGKPRPLCFSCLIKLRENQEKKKEKNETA